MAERKKDDDKGSQPEGAVGAAAEVGGDEVQKALDEEQERGYRGVQADETPNHAYTVAGVLAGEETPETRGH